MNPMLRASLDAKEIFKLVAPELKEVERTLQEEAQTALPLINDINRYLHNSGGKRLRPALLLLAAKLCDYDRDSLIRLGVVVEFIHVATLVHDDILDNADTRRGRPSVNAHWGNQVTVLMGDWLYMTSFELAVRERNFRILDVLIEVTRKMVEGELMQMERRGRAEVTAQEQLGICFRKTACLFSSCTQMAGILGGLEADGEEKLRTYGASLGMAFQLIDDLLDYTSDRKALGKPVLKDLEEGRVTLPIIFLLERADKQEREFVLEVVAQGNFSEANKREIIRLVESHGTLRQARELAKEYARQAKAALEGFPDSIYRSALLKVPDFVLERTH